MKRFEVIYKMGRKLEGPYSYIVSAATEDEAFTKFKNEWTGFRTSIVSISEVA